MIRQVDPALRYGSNTTTVENKNQCFSEGVDQGFHNWLVYSGILGRYMKVCMYICFYVCILFRSRTQPFLSLVS